MSNKASNKVRIGASWAKPGKNRDGQPSEFRSIQFVGKHEKDEYEVILRRKSDGAELSLSEQGSIMVDNSFKEKENQPDFVLLTTVE